MMSITNDLPEIFYNFEGNDDEELKILKLKLKRYLLQKKVVAAGSLRSRLAAAL